MLGEVVLTVILEAHEDTQITRSHAFIFFFIVLAGVITCYVLEESQSVFLFIL